MKKIRLQLSIVLILSVFAFSACEDGKMNGAARKATPAKNGLANGGSDGSGTGSGDATGAGSGGSETGDPNGDNNDGSTSADGSTSGAPGSTTAGTNGAPSICVGGKRVSLDGMGMRVNSENASDLANRSSVGQCNTSCHLQYPGHHGGSFNGRCEDSDCRIPGTKNDSQCNRCVYDEAC